MWKLVEAKLWEDGWDYPFYKIISANDSGKAKGNQGGIAIPKDLLPFFPVIDPTGITPKAPTNERTIHCDMHDGIIWRESVDARYHFQTWGGGRAPETRLTRLGEVWRASEKDDLFVFQRNLSGLNRFRVFRIPCSEFHPLRASRWGSLPKFGTPISTAELDVEASIIKAGLKGKEVLFDPDPENSLGARRVRVKQSSFRGLLMNAYNFQCCVSGDSLHTPDKLLFEPQAGHIIPVRYGGSYDLRNGIPLSATIHWAFDNGLFTITDSYEVLFSSELKAQKSDIMSRYSENKINLSSSVLKPSKRALQWHRENVFLD